MSEPTQLFPERFKAASRFYTTGRPTYPRLLSYRVASLVGLTRGDAVLDLGTGPGFLAIDFAPLARLVKAVDPAPEMLELARRNVAGLPVEVVAGRSDELENLKLGRFKLVTIGRAFHWMNRPATLVSLNGLVERAGAVALFGESYPDVPENAWHVAFQAAVDQYSVEDPAKSQIHGRERNEAVLLRSTFDHLERIAVLERRATPVERLVDRALSFASVWEGKAGSREEDLAHEIRTLVTPYADASGNVPEVLEGHALVARRSGELVTN